MLRRILCVLLGTVMLAGLLAGCEKNNDDVEDTERYVFTAAVCAPLTTLDPARITDPGEESVVSTLFEGLMRLRDDGTGHAAVTLGMAKEYVEETNYDSTVTYTFTLRSAARWSDGTRVKAEDFVYAWQRLVDPATDSPNASLLSMVSGYDEVRETGDVSALGVKAKGDSIFTVTLDSPCAYFISGVCTALATAPLRRDMVEGNASWDYSASLVTNGAYRIESWNRTTELVTERNPEYYEGKLVLPDALCFRFETDAEEKRALVLSGELDYAANVLCADDDEAAPLSHTAPLAETQCVLYNHLTDTFSNATIRQAFDLAIDRAGLAESIGASCTAATGCVPTGIGDRSDAEEDFRTAGGDFYEEGYDTALAGRLLTSAGHYQGAGLPTLRLVYVDGVQNRTVATALRTMWRNALGVTVEPVALDEEAYDAALAAGDYELALTTLSARWDDARAYLEPFSGTSERNVCGYRNNAYDLLIGVADSTDDLNARTAFLHDAEEILLEDHAVSPLYFSATSYLLRDGITGIAHDAFSRVCFFSAAEAAE